MKPERLLLVLAAALIPACASREADTPPPPSMRSDAGVVSEDQTYRVPVGRAWKAMLAALESADCRVQGRRRDECGGRIVARREDGRRVLVLVHAAERQLSEILIYVEPPDRALLDSIRLRLEEKLSLAKARSDLFGDNSVEASYDIDLDSAVEAAERACRALGLDVTFSQRREDRVKIEAKGLDDRTLRVSLGPGDAETDGIQVMLSAGSTPADQAKDFLHQARKELERQLFPAAK